MSRRAGLGAGVALLGSCLWLACTTPLAEGEARYREGDWLGALEIWRSIPQDAADHEAAQQRLADLEPEFEQLVLRYKQRARYFERAGRLAESLLNYRLALKLQPEDRETLSHVQALARRLAEDRGRFAEALRDDLEAGELGAAREHLDALTTLDPFDPALETQARELDERIQAEVERLLRRGAARFRRGDLDAAERQFRAAIALAPRNDAAQGYLSYLATVRREAKRTGVRPAQLHIPERFATEKQIRAQGLHQNAIAAEESGDPWRAIRYELRALHLDPGHVEARRHLTELREALAPRLDALIESGRDHFRREDLQSALDQWRRALLIDPTNARAREYVARAERMLENLERLRSEGPERVGRR